LPEVESNMVSESVVIYKTKKSNLKTKKYARS
jgi:hypothetical protein